MVDFFSLTTSLLFHSTFKPLLSELYTHFIDVFPVQLAANKRQHNNLLLSIMDQWLQHDFHFVCINNEQKRSSHLHWTNTDSHLFFSKQCLELNAGKSQQRPRSIQTVTVTKQEPKVVFKNEPIIIEARRPAQQQVSLSHFYLYLNHSSRL